MKTLNDNSRSNSSACIEHAWPPSCSMPPSLDRGRIDRTVANAGLITASKERSGSLPIEACSRSQASPSTRISVANCFEGCELRQAPHPELRCKLEGVLPHQSLSLGAFDAGVARPPYGGKSQREKAEVPSVEHAWPILGIAYIEVSTYESSQFLKARVYCGLMICICMRKQKFL